MNDFNTTFSREYDMRIIGAEYIGFGKYPQHIKSCDVSIICEENGAFCGSDACTYTLGCDGNYYKNDYIIWKVLKKAKYEYLLVSNRIIEARRYDFQYNNYETSEIRNWLNNDFFFFAFSPKQREIIQKVQVDNSLDSTAAHEESNIYLCNNTNDMVFLLSKSEILSFFPQSELRIRLASDYALSQGLYAFPRQGCWWLRSPYYYCGDDAWLINLDGSFYPRNNVKNPHYGIVPAIVIDTRLCPIL